MSQTLPIIQHTCKILLYRATPTSFQDYMLQHTAHMGGTSSGSTLRLVSHPLDRHPAHHRHTSNTSHYEIT